MKRIIGLLLAMLMLFPSTAFAAFSDVAEDASYASSINKLTALGVISGYEDGTFRPEGLVTRAEFAKLTVAALGQQEKVVNLGSASPFWDVPASHWAGGYISYVSANGYIKGYPNGAFQPDEQIAFEQVVTILVRMLGYTTEDVGYHWPRNYIEKASALGITDGFSYQAADLMTRGDIAMLLDRTLDTFVKSTPGAPDKKLIDTIGYQKLENVVFIAAKEQDISVPADEVKTSAGNYKYQLENLPDYIGRTCEIYLNKDSEIILAVPSPQQVNTIVVENVKGDDVYYMDNGTLNVLELEDETVIYNRGQKTSFAAVKSALELGSTMKVYATQTGKVEYALLDEGKMEGPVTVTSTIYADTSVINGMAIRPDARVYRNGLAVALTDLKAYDVVYYNPNTNVIMAYDEKRTGIYEEAYPSKAYVQSIQLSGVEYDIETKTATDKLNESAGAFKKNEKITILLGKDGAIADVIVDANSGLDSMGVVLSTRSELSTDEDTKGKLEFYVKMLKYDDNIYEYKANEDYDRYRGGLVRFDFDANGVINTMTRCTNSITGKLDKANRTLGIHQLSKDVKIIELVSNPEEGEASARLVELEDIYKTDFSGRDVLHAEMDKDFGDVVLLYLNNITNDGYSYGILKDKNVINQGMMVSGTYTIDIAGQEYRFQLPSAYTLGKGQPVGVDISGGSLNEMFALKSVGRGSKVQAVDLDRIKVDNKVYRMAQDVVVYKRDNTTYNRVPISVNELPDMDTGSVELFADKELSFGGKVRIIIVTDAR